jgi:hypothetical protein
MRLWAWHKIIWHGGLALKAMLVGDALALVLLARDEVLGERWQRALRLSSLPSLSVWQWTTIVAALFTLFVLEGAYQFAKGLGAEDQFQKGRIREEPQPGVLDSIPAGRRAAGEMRCHSKRLAKEAGLFGPRMIDYGRQVSEAGDDVPKLTRIIRRATRDVNRYSGTLEREGAALKMAVTQFERNYVVWVGGLLPGKETEKKRQLIEEVNELSKSTAEAWLLHKDTATALGDLNIYQPLTTATKRLQLAQDGVIGAFRDSETATRKMLDIMNGANASG